MARAKVSSWPLCRPMYDGLVQSLVTSRFRTFQNCSGGGLALRISARPGALSPAHSGDAPPAIRWHSAGPTQAQESTLSWLSGDHATQSRCLHPAELQFPPDPALRPAGQQHSAGHPGAGAPVVAGDTAAARRGDRRCVGLAKADLCLCALRPCDERAAGLPARLLDSRTASTMTALDHRRPTRRSTWRPMSCCVHRDIGARAGPATSRYPIGTAHRWVLAVVAIVSQVCRALPACSAGADQSPKPLRATPTVALAAVSSLEAYATPTRTHRASATVCARGQVSHKP